MWLVGLLFTLFVSSFLGKLLTISPT